MNKNIYSKAMEHLRISSDFTNRTMSHLSNHARAKKAWTGWLPMTVAAAFICVTSVILYSLFLKQPADVKGGGQSDTQIYTYPVREWVNYYYNNEMPWDISDDLELPEFPDTVFRWTPYAVTAINSNGEEVLFDGLPVLNVYLADLSGDGIPELCSTVRMGSGIVDEYIVVYDYAAKKLYELSDKGYYHYFLSLDNGQLRVDQLKKYFDIDEEADILSGELALIDGELTAIGLDRTIPSVAAETEPTENYWNAMFPEEWLYGLISLEKSEEGLTNMTVYINETDCYEYQFDEPSIPEKHSLIDIDSDGVPEIFVMLDTLGNGGAGTHSIYIFKYSAEHNNFIQVALPDLPNYRIEFSDNYKYTVSSPDTGFAAEQMDVYDVIESDYMLNGLYGVNGEILAPAGGVDGVFDYEDIDIDGKKGFLLRQYVFGVVRAHNVGDAVTVYVWNGMEFEIYDQYFEPNINENLTTQETTDSANYTIINQNMTSAEAAKFISDNISAEMTAEEISELAGTTPVGVFAALDGREMLRYDVLKTDGYSFENPDKTDALDFDGLKGGEVKAILFIYLDGLDTLESFSVYYYSGKYVYYTIGKGVNVDDNYTRIIA